MTNDLEQKIAAWRALLAAAFPGQPETVRELEAHLRDHIEVQTKRGLPAEEAFAQGVTRIGEPRVIAREFQQKEKTGGFVFPVVVIYGLVGATYLTILAFAAWTFRYPVGAPFNLLLATHLAAISGGYLALLAAGLLGCWTLISGWRRPSPARELSSQRRELLRMATVASVMTPIGIVLGMAWARDHLPGGAWSWAPLEIGALSIMLSSWLLFATQRWPGADPRLRGALGLLGAVVVGFGWIGARAVTSVVPIAWLCGSALVAQGAVALLSVRAKSPAASAATDPVRE